MLETYCNAIKLLLAVKDIPEKSLIESAISKLHDGVVTFSSVDSSIDTLPRALPHLRVTIHEYEDSGLFSTCSLLLLVDVSSLNS